MDRDLVWRHIDEQRGAVADLLESLAPRDWDQPSLCSGWSIRDVGAHLTFAQARVRDLIVPAARAGFRYHVTIQREAVRSPLTHEQIVATLRGFVGSRRRVAFITDLEPLIDVLVHSQDIAIPLGIDHRLPVDAVVAATDRALALRWPMSSWRLPHGVRLVATDADWAHGEGVVVEAPMQEHLLAVTGRGGSLS